jgi:hypothetical protein
MSAKNIAIVVDGAGDTSEIKEITILPGTTIKEIKQATGLHNYRFSKGKGEPFITEDDNIYGMLEDGEKLHASTETAVG